MHSSPALPTSAALCRMRFQFNISVNHPWPRKTSSRRNAVFTVDAYQSMYRTCSQRIALDRRITFIPHGAVHTSFGKQINIIVFPPENSEQPALPGSRIGPNPPCIFRPWSSSERWSSAKLLTSRADLSAIWVVGSVSSSSSCRDEGYCCLALMVLFFPLVIRGKGVVLGAGLVEDADADVRTYVANIRNPIICVYCTREWLEAIVGFRSV